MRMRGFLVGLVAAGLFGLGVAPDVLAAVNGLTQKAGTAGCVSDTGAGPCADGRALDQATSVAVSPDGANAYVSAGADASVSTFDRNPVTGALTQKANTAGCVSETGDVGDCADGTALTGANAVTVSPDGANVYVASFSSNAVAIFDRNTTTGVLSQKAGTAGCISESGTAGACVDGRALNGPTKVTVSPDGANVYVASLNSSAVAIFDRNTTTGALTQKAGVGGCISETGTAGACVDGTALGLAFDVTVSPDGASAYVASLLSGAVAIFDRNTSTGALTQEGGTAGCVSETGAGSCADGKALDQAVGVTVSPDGANVYVASQHSNAVAIFDRDASSGSLTQKAGTAGCVSETGTAGACTDGRELNGANSVVVSPDGASAYVASGAGVAILDRSSLSGGLNQKPGTAGCVSDTGSAGACADGVALAGPDSLAISPNNRSVYMNASDSDAVAIFDRDLPPETTIESGPDELTNDGTPTFAFSSSDPGSSFLCKLDGDDEDRYIPCSGPGATHTAGPLADGPHELQVAAVDPGNNTDKTPAVRAFTIDTAAPETTIGKRPKARLKTRKRRSRVTVAFESEAGATFECSFDGAAFQACGAPFSTRAKAKRGRGAKHTFTVRATDLAGNVETSPPSTAFKVVRKG